MTPAKAVHIAGGFIIGCAGLFGIPALHCVLVREKYQETEVYMDSEKNVKTKTNVAWSDLQEWLIGLIPGTGVHAALVFYYVDKLV